MLKKYGSEAPNLKLVISLHLVIMHLFVANSILPCSLPRHAENFFISRSLLVILIAQSQLELQLVHKKRKKVQF